MHGVPGAIREGLLGVRRRKGVEPRYFVLFEDRLDYFYKEEEAVAGAEPRGRLALSDIRRFEVSDVELSFHLGSQTLVLTSVEGADLQPWSQDVRVMLQAGAAGGEIPWEEVERRLPTSHDPKGRAARTALFERLDRDRSGSVPIAESERFLLERLTVRQVDGGGKARRVRLVSGLPPLEPAVHRAVDVASDVASHHTPGEAEGLDRRGFHAALIYLRDYLELCALYKEADASAEVDAELAKPLVDQWGISERAERNFAGCKRVKFEDFADWLLWCKLMHSESLDLDDPDDYPLHKAPNWRRIEETAAARIQRAQRARQVRGAGAGAEEPPAAEAEAAEARVAEAEAAAARETEARVAEAAATQAREAETKAAEAAEAEAQAEAPEAAEARAAEARAAEALEAEARAEAREAQARAAEARAVEALRRANDEEAEEEEATETEEAEHDAGVLCQGLLTVAKGGKSSTRHHVLFCDRLCFYESERDFFQGKDPRGSIALADVEAVEEMMGKSFQLLLKNSASVTEFQAESKEDTERWLHAWALVLQGNLGVSFARAKHKSVYAPPQPAADDASQADQPTVICEGSIDMMKKSKVERRYFVLFERHFEYFNSQEEFGAGAPPRCRVALEDVQDVEVSSSGELLIQLAQGKTFELRSRGGRADARKWGRAWDKALSEGIFLGGAGTVSWSGDGWEEEAAPPEPAAEAPAAEGSLPEAALFASEAAEPAENETASESWREPERGKREVSKQTTVTWDLKVDEERVLHEGVLVMGLGEDNLQPRFAVVLSDRLEYTSDWGREAKASGPPRTRILRSQIRDAEVVDEGFNLELDDGVLLMRTSCEADQQAWLEALEAMFNDQEPSAPPVNGHAPVQEPFVARPHVLLQEALGMECGGGQVVTKHCVLYPDCLEYFGSLAEAESGARPHGVLWSKDFVSLEVLDSDLVVHASSRTVVLFPKDRASFLAWQKALLPLFSGSGGDGLCWSRHDASATEAPPLCQGAFLVSWGLGGVEAEEMVVLRPDCLECGSGRISTHEIEDVEVCDEGFVVHGRGGCRLSLRSAQDAVDMEAWSSALGRALDGDEPAADSVALPVPASHSEPSSGSRGGQGAAAASVPCRKLCRTSSDLAAGPTRCVHEGPLELEPWRGPRRPQHAVLYGNKLDLFGAAEEADGGHPPCVSVPVGHIQELRVLDLAFELRTFAASAPRQLRAPARRDFEEWRRAWGLVLGDDDGIERRADGRGWFRRPGLGASRASLPAQAHRAGGSLGGSDQPRSSSSGRGADQPRSASSGRGRWALGRAATSGNLLSRGRILHQGPLALVRNGRTEAYHFVAFANRLEYFLDAAQASAGSCRRGVLRPGDIREVRVLEHGFVLGMNREIIELHVASTRDMDVWVKVLRTVLDPAAVAEEEPLQVPAEDHEEELEGMSSYFSQAPVEASCLGGGGGAETLDSAGGAILAAWLDSLQEPPLHRGELGFQDRGRLAKRYCVLFRDRLDCWEAASQVGSKPLVRIQLSDVRGLEIISSGFVLNSRGKRTGVHVSNNEELQVWTHALLSVLAPSESSEATTPAASQTSVPSTPSGAGAAPRPSRPRSVPQGGGGGAAQRASSAKLRGLRSRTPTSPRPAPFVPRVGNLTPGAASRGQSPQRPGSHQSSSSLRSARDAGASVTAREAAGPSIKLGRPRGRESGGEWACREVAAKIVEPALGRSPLLQRKEERASVAEKVTGRPANAARARAEISGKITDLADGGRSQGVASRGHGAAVGEAVAPKVGEPGRAALVSARSGPAHGVTEKITHARSCRRPAATPPGRHMGQPLGLPGHAPGFLA